MHHSIAQVSNISLNFVQIEQNIQYANYSAWQSDIISIDLHSKREQNGGAMHPGSSMRSIIELMNSLALYVKRAIYIHGLVDSSH